MEVRAVLPHQGEPVSAQLSELIGTIGTSSFEPTLINFTRQTIGCDHVIGDCDCRAATPKCAITSRSAGSASSGLKL